MKLTDRKECTDWFSESKYGLFFHYLFSIEQMQKFDAEKFAHDVNEMGAGYVIFTMGQNSGYYCGPNPTYESMTGNAPGTKCYAGDVPMQAAKALERYGIRLMIYLPSHPPTNDNAASIKIGVDQSDDGNWVMDENTVKNWTSIVKDWSLHYGKNISGWWFDGFYPMIALDENLAEYYKKAVLAGNDESILALNQGLESTVYPANKYCDYTAGEFEVYEPLPTERFVDGAQWHMACFMGENWNDGSVKVGGDTLADYIAKVNAKGGVVSVGLHINEDGSASEEQLEAMRIVKNKIRG